MRLSIFENKTKSEKTIILESGEWRLTLQTKTRAARQAHGNNNVFEIFRKYYGWNWSMCEIQRCGSLSSFRILKLLSRLRSHVSKWFRAGVGFFSGIFGLRLHCSRTIPIIHQFAITSEMETLRNDFGIVLTQSEK